MDFLELAKERYSVRSFKSDAVPEEIVNRIIEAGCVAPTACNRQSFKIIAVTSPDGLERFRKCTECHFNAPLAFIVCSDREIEWKRRFDGKPSGDVDASIVATHMMLEAASLGIGSTWVMYFMPDAVRKEFALPDRFEPVACLPMGYPSETAAPSPMHSSCRSLEELVSFV